MSCYACKVAETHPKTQLRGHADCLGCDARALAQQFGGQPINATTAVMRKAWPEQERFTAGRTLFWMWVRVFDELAQKERT